MLPASIEGLYDQCAPGGGKLYANRRRKSFGELRRPGNGVDLFYIEASVARAWFAERGLVGPTRSHARSLVISELITIDYLLKPTVPR